MSNLASKIAYRSSRNETMELEIACIFGRATSHFNENSQPPTKHVEKKKHLSKTLVHIDSHINIYIYIKGQAGEGTPSGIIKRRVTRGTMGATALLFHFFTCCTACSTRSPRTAVRAPFCFIPLSLFRLRFFRTRMCRTSATIVPRHAMLASLAAGATAPLHIFAYMYIQCMRVLFFLVFSFFPLERAFFGEMRRVGQLFAAGALFLFLLFFSSI